MDAMEAPETSAAPRKASDGRVHITPSASARASAWSATCAVTNADLRSDTIVVRRGTHESPVAADTLRARRGPQSVHALTLRERDRRRARGRTHLPRAHPRRLATRARRLRRRRARHPGARDDRVR